MAQFQHQQQTCTLTGKLSRQEVIELWPQQQAILSDQITAIDLSRLDYVDSSGVAFLFHLIEAGNKNGRTVNLINPSKQLQPLIALYNLQSFFS
ncbi:phospholipid ABC transporter [Shewanella sp. OPT22]|nr:phospholipid ABC transporter [Shewanella sp. OPT22]